MYMICETLGDNDLRVLPGMKRLYTHWIFTTYYVPDSIKINLKDYGGIKLEEDVARAMKFAMVDKGKIGIRPGTSIHEDLFAESLETDIVKQYYYLTETDEINTTKLMKSEMYLYLDMHYSVMDEKTFLKYQGKKQEVLSLIDSCKSVTDCQKLQHTHFGVENVSHAKNDWKLGDASFNLSKKGLDTLFHS